MHISFCRRIPLTQCQIKDTETNKFIPATFCEVDCKDKEDILDIANLTGKWNFKSTIAKNMQIKQIKKV